jgi:hypothetical protein
MTLIIICQKGETYFEKYKQINGKNMPKCGRRLERENQNFFQMAP